MPDAPSSTVTATTAPATSVVASSPNSSGVEPSGAEASRIESAEAESPRARQVPLILAIALPILFFFLLPPLAKSGLWDPYELNVADLARRVALNLFHADSLALTGADNSFPHLNDLGRPELAFTSIALGFKVFGLHEWAGRAPLALWGVFGVLATYAFVARLIDRRAGLYAAVALTTMPLYFVQARTMLGDVVTMSAFAMAFGGLAVAVFDRDSSGPTGARARIAWLGLGVFGLVAGFESRGGVLGVAVPLLGVGLAWAMSWAGGDRKRDTFGDAVGGASLALGLVVLVSGMIALSANVQSSSKLIAWVMLGESKPGDLNLWLGATVKTPAKYPTFDFYIGHLGHALAPWSAFAPFAIGRLFVPPTPPVASVRQREILTPYRTTPGPLSDAQRIASVRQRESFTRMALIVGIAVALAAHAFLASKTELIAFCAPALIAAACGIAIRDFERGAHASIAVGVGTVVFLGLFHHDFHELPEKAYQAYAVVGATFPDSFKEHALVLWTVALIGFAGVVFLTWVERDADRTPFDPKGYLKVLRALRDAWDGFLALTYFAAVAGASIAAIAIWVGVKTHARWLPNISLQIRDGVLNAWWAVGFVPLAVILGVYYACDVWLWAFGGAKPLSSASWTRGFEPFEQLFDRLRAPATGTEEKAERAVAAGVLVPFMILAFPAGVCGALLAFGAKPLVALCVGIPSGAAFFLFMGGVGELLRGSRAAFMVLSAVAVGFVLCFSYYPALANQLSPKEVFESYERMHKAGEPLALLGVGGRTSAYYAGGDPASFTDVQHGYDWLVGGQGQRRFLAIKADELPKLNQLYREHSNPRMNVPVLDGRSSQIVLVASGLEEGDKNQNPLNKIVLPSAPHPQHKIDVNMEDKLEVTGYDLTDQGGRFVDSIAPGRKYRMRTYYRVLAAPITTEWEAFIHIDGFHRRHNGDHKPMDGKYPFSLWLKDDLLVDDYEFGLEPNFSPGSYTLFFGLFVGETRLHITSGPNDGEHRINGGQIRVQ